jgi:hypothetical protein
MGIGAGNMMGDAGLLKEGVEFFIFSTSVGLHG